MPSSNFALAPWPKTGRPRAGGSALFDFALDHAIIARREHVPRPTLADPFDLHQFRNGRRQDRLNSPEALDQPPQKHRPNRVRQVQAEVITTDC